MTNYLSAALYLKNDKPAMKVLSGDNDSLRSFDERIFGLISVSQEEKEVYVVRNMSELLGAASLADHMPQLALIEKDFFCDQLYDYQVN